MNEDTVQKVLRNPKFHELVEKKTRLGWILSIIMLIIYYGFTLILAFSPATLGTSLSGGTTTIGIPIGIAIILSAFILTGIYVKKANSEFDALNSEIVEDAKS